MIASTMSVLPEKPARLRAEIRGVVQGVGFRPFACRLARALALSGWVRNSPQGAVIEVEGPPPRLEEFLLRLEAEKPTNALIQELEPVFLEPEGFTRFEILSSLEQGAPEPHVLPDLATCDACRQEIFDPTDRRYRYPFTNCTDCGPRFSIIESLPYDRPRTSMKQFPMCPACQEEYENSSDRRHHAQANACPACGPHLALWDRHGRAIAEQHDALRAAAQAIREGGIVAMKGLGGFQLLVDARSAEAVNRLRDRKGREEKPFAVMYPDLETTRRDCDVSPLEEDLLTSPQMPIVLLARNPEGSGVDHSVAPGNPTLGVMLPYTPLHHLLMAELGHPIVATSGNLSDEPICTREDEALEHLASVADCFLVHDRPIVRHVDDSITRVMAGRETVLRRARGYAPLPVTVHTELMPFLAVGGHLKNTVAVGRGRDVSLSQHIGDLDTFEAIRAFEAVGRDLQALYEITPMCVVCDKHPDYQSTRFAESLGLPVTRVQHHYAHVLAGMAEHGLQGPVLGVAWDGTGYGDDGTIWGGEFLAATLDGFDRVAHLKTFRLPGSDKAALEPWRSMLGILYGTRGSSTFEAMPRGPACSIEPAELKVLSRMLERGLNSPETSSAGRLFDAVAALVGARATNSFEGQAAMALEHAIGEVRTDERYPFRLQAGGADDPAPRVIDWRPMIEAILEDVHNEKPRGEIAARFHNTLVAMIVAVARSENTQDVVLTGGCFQNKYLLEHAVHELEKAGFRPYCHQRVPPNDGGIALGQAMIANRLLRAEGPAPCV